MNWLEYLGDGMPKMKEKLIELEKELPLFASGDHEIDLVEQAEPCCEERCTEKIEWKRAHEAFSALEPEQKRSALGGIMYVSLPHRQVAGEIPSEL